MVAKGKAGAKSGAKDGKGAKMSAKQKAEIEAMAKRNTRQAIAENPSFKGFCSTQVYSTMVGGSTLYDKLYKDKLDSAMKKPNAPSFGSSYYRALANSFRGSSSDTSSVSVLRPRTEGLAVHQTLIDAMFAWESNPKRAGPFMEYLQLGEQVCFVVVVGWG